jgi:hypothetical protein
MYVYDYIYIILYCIYYIYCTVYYIYIYLSLSLLGSRRWLISEETCWLRMCQCARQPRVDGLGGLEVFDPAFGLYQFGDAIETQSLPEV